MCTELIQIQDDLARQISLKNSFDLNNIKAIAGVDIAYDNKSNLCICCISVLDFHSQSVLEEVHYSSTADFPYISGFLAFRELPVVMEAVKLLRTAPDLYMFDGNGYLHPRHMDWLRTHHSSLKCPLWALQRHT